MNFKLLQEQNRILSDKCCMPTRVQHRVQESRFKVFFVYIGSNHDKELHLSYSQKSSMSKHHPSAYVRFVFLVWDPKIQIPNLADDFWKKMAKTQEITSNRDRTRVLMLILCQKFEWLLESRRCDLLPGVAELSSKENWSNKETLVEKHSSKEHWRSGTLANGNIGRRDTWSKKMWSKKKRNMIRWEEHSSKGTMVESRRKRKLWSK